MRIVIGCGGTGGHISPALAIADVVRANDKKAQIEFVGGEKGMEGHLVPAAGYPIKLLHVQGLSRSLSPKNLGVLWEMRRAVAQVREWLRAARPDMVIGTGGYACYPTLRAAVSLGIPTAVHESNATPGLAVRRLARQVDRVWVCFAQTASALPKGTHVLTVGNPVRRISSLPHKRQAEAVHVLSFGGSLGADALNLAVLSLMEAERELPYVCHLHATGKARYADALTEFERRGLQQCDRFALVPFIEDMPQRMATADLVICRAGAMSISEIAALGKAAVLVPSPNVTGDHQYKNARLLADANAALLVEERNLAEGALSHAALMLLHDAGERERLARAVGAFATPDADRLIYEDIRRLVGK